MIEIILQAVITVTGALAVLLLLQPKDRLGRWGGIVGMLGQPFWLYATFTGGAWGMFVASIAWTVVWAYAIWQAWIAPQLREDSHVGSAE